MSKLVRCDHIGCPKLGIADSIYGNAPDGWFTIATRGKPEKHYCSLVCLADALSEEAEAVSRG